MTRRILPLFCAIFATATFGISMAACSTPPDVRTPVDAAATDSAGRYPPSTKEERAFLAHVATLPSNQPARVEGFEVVASPPYDAASGYRCRRLMLARGGEQSVRLACGDEQGWFFAPDVTGGARGETP